jgi:hypothetical protein
MLTSELERRDHGRARARAADGARPRHAVARPLLAAVLALAITVAVAADVAPARAAAPLSWSEPVSIHAAAMPRGIACPSEALCVAVDGAGNVLTSTDPAAPSPSWTGTPVRPGHPPLTAVSCASTTLCVAVDADGNAYTSIDPTGGEAAWSAAAVDPGRALSAVSCPDTSLCVAVDEAGDVLALSVPGGWSPPTPVDSTALTAISCASSVRCAAVDATGDVLTSSDPAARPPTWSTPRPISRGLALRALSCPGTALCAALDGEGDVLASADPWAAGAATWGTTQIGLGGAPVAISCAGSGLCVAVDGGERALASDDAATSLPAWSESRAAAGLHLASIACLGSGICFAADTLGRAVTGRVPPPQAITQTATEVAQTSATLAGTVDPNDAILAGCVFELGTSTAYGTLVPCSATPAPGSAQVPVSGQIAGLAPNTTYHYRLLAASAIARGAGEDVSFTTAAQSGVPLLIPHPSIHGTPAVGQRLTCSAGVSGASRLAYAWLRDLIPIPFATSSSYLVKGVDSGHHLQCQVTASDPGGNATARSAFVTIPVGGIPASAGETSVGRPRLRGRVLEVPVNCSPRAGNGCNVSLRLTTVETLSGRRVVGFAAALHRTRLTLASARAFLATGTGRTVALALSSTARKLIARKRVPGKLTASGTIIGVLEATISSQLVLLGPGSHSAAHHGRTRHS